MSEDSLHHATVTAAAALIVAALYALITIDQRDPACALFAGWFAGIVSTVALACHWENIEPVHPFLECVRTGLQPTPDHQK